ncbi:uncharacterized protein EAF01_002769 [Botrytis porri]|uniref:uncharacterized protein n=1 Tax=Botrytis porri TaxID=87229 RepID=UPI0019027FEF|nr:uncharacterized protein EAF01_002769 [Botrytis porri]KAF7911262.1 hypothetical protein EAF01_002769 [Botrytis porri]
MFEDAYLARMTLTSSLHKEWDGPWSEGGKESVHKCKKPREVVFERGLFVPAFGDSETSTKSSSPDTGKKNGIDQETLGSKETNFDIQGFQMRCANGISM